MPLSISDRRALVLGLIRLPLSNAEIGQVLGVNVSTVANDISALRRAERSIVRPEKPSYATRLAVYAQTFSTNPLDLSPEITIEVRKVLRIGLNLEGFQAAASAMIDGINMARVPKIPPHLWNTQRLVYAIFGRATPPIDQFLFRPWDPRPHGCEIDLAYEMVRDWFPRAFSSGINLESVVKDHVDLARQFVAFKVHEGQVMEHHIAPLDPDRPADTRVDVVVNDAIKQRIDRGVAGLGERHQKVLRLRYPEDGSDGKTLSEVGKTMRLSRERIRQIEFEALKQMRMFLVEGGVDMHPVSTTAAAVANYRYQSGRFIAGNSREHAFANYVSRLDLQLRAEEVLEELGVVQLCDLAGMGDGDILHAPGGGLSVLNEVKAKLGGIGLSLGTLISDSKED